LSLHELLLFVVNEVLSELVAGPGFLLVGGGLQFEDGVDVVGEFVLLCLEMFGFEGVVHHE
jgi:hypothetical protein